MEIKTKKSLLLLRTFDPAMNGLWWFSRKFLWFDDLAFYRRIHFLLFFDPFSRAALVAASNTSLTPSLVFAEHSLYSLAPAIIHRVIKCNRCLLTFIYWMSLESLWKKTQWMNWIYPRLLLKLYTIYRQSVWWNLLDLKLDIHIPWLIKIRWFNDQHTSIKYKRFSLGTLLRDHQFLFRWNWTDYIHNFMGISINFPNNFFPL